MLYGWTDRPYLSRRVSSATWPHPSRDPVTAANQRLTHRWWNECRHDYELFTSKFVADEATEGDQVVAERRLALLEPIPLLASDGTAAEALAKALVRGVPLPARAYGDAMHIAIAAINGMAYVLTWNCKHIANPRLLPRMLKVAAAWGISLLALRTPAEL